MLKQLFINKNYLLKVTCLFWLIGKVLSYKLWLANRFFPIIPPFDFLLQVPSFIHTILFTGSLLLLFFSIFFANKKILIALLFIEILSCFLDQNRWQPWQYQYVITLFIFIINFSDTIKINNWILLICAATYFYSGLQKFNPGFLAIVWQDTFLHRFFKLPMHIVNHKLVANIGYVLPMLEVVSGISFFIKRFQKIAIIFLIAMHLLILAIIGPWSLVFNIIVWPWNVLMIFYLVHFVVTKSYQTFTIKSVLTSRNIALAIVWCCFPLLNFIGYWDNFMSCSLYSGRIPNMEICVEENLPKEIQPFFQLRNKPKICTSNDGVNIQVWGMNEILVPPLPQVRVYKKVKEALQKKYPTMKARYFVCWLPKSQENYMELK